MALAAEPNVIFPAETSPGKATSSRLAFEQAISDVMARVVGRFLVDVETLGVAELDRHNALVAAGGPSVLDKSALLGDARDQGASVFVIRSLWERITDTAVDGAIDAMLSALPLPLRWRVFERMVRERFLSTIDEPDVFDLAYTIIDTAVRDVTENGVSRRQAERTMKEELSYLKPTGEATEFAWRAERLARTASTTLYNDAMIDQLADDGFTHKLWVTYHDDKVRETHQQADGMSIPIEQPFVVGGSPMMQPGDTSAPIGEWINCRCVIVGENGPTTPGIDWSIPVMTESERIEAGFPADISLAASGNVIPDMKALAARRSLNYLVKTLYPARGYASGPTQARAPKGSTIGGQWIMTPGGLLERASNPLFHIAAPGTDLPNRMTSTERVRDTYFENLPEKDKEDLAFATRLALSHAAEGGVNINVEEHELEGILDTGRFTTLRERTDAKGMGAERGGRYNEQRFMYEREIMGVPLERATSQDPVYGYGSRKDANETDGYGDIQVRLKDDVLGRTTWTTGDSFGRRSRPIYTDEIVTGSTEDMVAGSQWVGDYIAGTKDRTELRRRRDAGGESWTNAIDRQPYFEAQVHGGVNVSDIAEIVYSEKNPPSEEVLSKLDDLRIPHRPSSSSERQAENQYEIDWARDFRQRVDEFSNPRPPEPEPKPVEPLPADIQKILDDIGAWEGGGRTLTASGNPNQARVPAGNPSGGRWIDTPSGLLHNMGWRDEDDSIISNGRGTYTVPDLADQARSVNRDEGDTPDLPPPTDFTPEEVEALKNYTGSFAAEVNQNLRYGIAGDSQVRDIDSAFESSKMPYPTYVYRTMPGENFPNYSDNTPEEMASLVGKVIRDRAYLSTTTDDYAEYGVEGSSALVRFQIVVPAGTSAIDMKGISLVPYENEILLPRDLPLAITGVSQDEDGNTIIDMTVAVEEAPNA